MDHYTTLGVNKNASPEEIKKAYRKMAGIHHPDKGGDTGAFQNIQTAYDTLSDPNKKQQYDQPTPQGGFNFNTQGFGGGVDINDMFAQMFGQQRGHPPGIQQFRTTIWVSLDQVYSGGEQTLQLQGPNGTTVVRVQIPKGVESGATIRYNNVVPGGILLVEFRVHNHIKYERQGNNLHSIHRINVLDLIVGTSFDFITLDGKTLQISVNAKTQPDSTLRIPSKGLPIPNGPANSYGDQLILLKPFLPDMIDNQITDSILLSRKS